MMGLTCSFFLTRKIFQTESTIRRLYVGRSTLRIAIFKDLGFTHCGKKAILCGVLKICSQEKTPR